MIFKKAIYNNYLRRRRKANIETTLSALNYDRNPAVDLRERLLCSAYF